MKYSVIQCVNGNNSVVSEDQALTAAKKSFWNRCVVLEDAVDVITGECAVFDETLSIPENLKQKFEHPAPEPTPEEPTE